MGRLASVDRVLRALQLQDRDSNRESIEEALEEISPLLENIIGSFWDRRDYQDIWITDSSWRKSEDTLGATKLRLTCGYLNPEDPVRVEDLGTTTDFRENNDTKTRITRDDGLSIDYNMGTVKIIDLAHSHVYRIRYTAGYTESNGEYQDVPDWLSAAAVSAAVKYMRAFQQKWNAKDIKDTSGEIHRIMERQLTSRIRTKYGEHPYESLFEAA